MKIIVRIQPKTKFGMILEEYLTGLINSKKHRKMIKEKIKKAVYESCFNYGKQWVEE